MSSDADGITEEASLPTSSLVAAVGHELQVSKKGYVEVLRPLFGEVQ